jgi:hypothetical protein
MQLDDTAYNSDSSAGSSSTVSCTLRNWMTLAMAIASSTPGGGVSSSSPAAANPSNSILTQYQLNTIPSLEWVQDGARKHIGLCMEQSSCSVGP